MNGLYSNSITTVHKGDFPIFSIPFWYDNKTFYFHEIPYLLISLNKEKEYLTY